MHHNEKDGTIIGRIKSVEYKETGTRTGTPALIFTSNIGDEEGKKGIKNGTLSTVSIGVIAHDLRCSICGTNLAEEGMCEHEKGEVYGEDNKLCYWIINKMEPKEVSYVIVPSDIYAHNLKVYEAVKKKKSEVKESVNFYDNPFAEIIESTKAAIDAQEGKQIDEEIKDKATDVPEEPKAKEESEAKVEDKSTEEESKESKEEKEETPEKESAKEESKEEAKEEQESKEETEEEEKKEEAEKTEEKEESKEAEENKELEDAKQTIAELEKEIASLKAVNKKLESKVEKVNAAKESVEKELVRFRAEKKKSLVESVNKLRAELNLPLEDEKALLESTEETLHITIKSLNEFTQVQKQVFGMQTMASPVAISEEKDNTSNENKKVKDVKESTQDSNMTLEDEYINLMRNIF
ncbi:hypothetical protein [Paraclostridium dentum]|uniref:hypothetical protein n=1 Tax=Paraclostridium dentum TaxID=2662455 RepID=UPI003F3B1507